MFEGDFKDAAVGILKWTAPLAYGAWLYQQALEDDAVVASTTVIFMVVVPLLGIYGIVQYIYPPDWDLYWMAHVPSLPVGIPEPYGVRVFGTMNASASFATYTVCGMLLMNVARAGWLSAILAFPGMLAVLLSTYRTAWVGLVVGAIVCLLTAATRRRAIIFALVGSAAIFLTIIATPFDAVVVNRIDTFSQGSSDKSVHERLAEYEAMLTKGTLWGYGFASAENSGEEGVPLVDGQLIVCWYAMGLAVGLICCSAIILAAWRAVVHIGRSTQPTQIALGAATASMIVQLPLASIASGEMGVLFWGFLGLAAARAPRDGYNH